MHFFLSQNAILKRMKNFDEIFLHFRRLWSIFWEESSGKFLSMARMMQTVLGAHH